VRTFNSACQQNKNYLGDSLLTKSQLRNLESMIRAQADILFVSSNGGPLIYVNEVAYIGCGPGVLRSLLTSMQAVMIYDLHSQGAVYAAESDYYHPP
jgi:hypothetical protein